MARTTMNLQDSFLNQMRKEATEIKLLLLDGTTLKGTVRGFDNFTVIVSSGGGQHLIYKHAIAQIVTTRITRRREEDRRAPSPRPDARPPAPKVEKEEPKKDGFNTLNLSQVVLSEKSKE